MWSARSAGGVSKRATSGTRTPSTEAISRTSRAASIEWPPRARSRRPARPRRGSSTRAGSRKRGLQAELRSAHRTSPPRQQTGPDRPSPSRGISSTATMTAGTIYCGSRSARVARSSVGCAARRRCSRPARVPTAWPRRRPRPARRGGRAASPRRPPAAPGRDRSRPAGPRGRARPPARRACGRPGGRWRPRPPEWSDQLGRRHRRQHVAVGRARYIALGQGADSWGSSGSPPAAGPGRPRPAAVPGRGGASAGRCVASSRSTSSYSTKRSIRSPRRTASTATSKRIGPARHLDLGGGHAAEKAFGGAAVPHGEDELYQRGVPGVTFGL